MASTHTERFMQDVELTPEPDAPLINALVAYWESKRAGRIAPRRADIDPTDLAPHLPNIFMLDVLEGGTDFSFRLIGTGIVRGMGRDSTGKRLSDLYRAQPAALAKLTALFGK